MTLDEAREFYFQYCGFSFHMDREEPAKYGSFRMLGLGKEVLSAWDEELLDGLFADLRLRRDRVWVLHGNILKIIGRNYCETGRNLARLLDEMERMSDLDLFQITLIIENMAGRTERMTDGGVYVFCRYSDLAGRMNDVMERLIAVCASGFPEDDRFHRAVHRYRLAYGTWTAPNRI